MLALSLALVVLAAPAAPAQTLSADPLRQQVDAYLGTLDRPVPPSAWRALGPGAVPLLEQIVADPGQLPTRRAKAMEALGATDAQAAQSVATTVAPDDGQPYVLRSAALRVLSWVLPAEQLRGSLVPLMGTARDIRLRADAAELLARRAHACAEVKAQVAREAPGQAGFFHRALRVCSGR